jgi:hypothetical protein
LLNLKRVAWLVRKPEDAFEAEASGPAAASAPVDRGAVVAAVEKYLAGRGVAKAPPATAAAAPASRTAIVEEVVDRFLASRKVPPPASAPAPGCPAPAAPAVEAAPAIADFVCESDVREAIRAGRRIHIGPKTIVTPSARDLGEQSGVLLIARP